MGSRKEFREMVKLVNDRQVKPIIDAVVDGLERADECFTIMKEGSQFGKLVILVAKDAEAPKL